ncbi:unnamed protein product [Phytomonas sp. Hart1]|nr:unnamed protein product [Phytomonas sp. Hart1]|eukprot:CCW71540.1 unnamed protein product [Phytomonas sp. isolate Hart1]
MKADMSTADFSDREEECGQEGSFEMIAGACSNPTEYALLANRFKLLKLVQRIAHVDVMDMIEAVGLDALISKDVLRRFSPGPSRSNAVRHTRDPLVHSISPRVHAGKVDPKGYFNKLVRGRNQGSALSCTPRGEPSFSAYVPRRTRDDERAIAAALNNQPSRAPRPRFDANKNGRSNLEKEGTLDMLHWHHKSAMAARGPHRFRSGDEKDAFFARMAVPKYYYSEPLIEDVQSYDQSDVFIKGEKDTAASSSIPPVLPRFHPMSESARIWRGKVIETRVSPSPSSSPCSPYPIPTDKLRANPTVGGPFGKEDPQGHLRSPQGLGIRGHDPPLQSTSSLTRAPSPFLSSRPPTDLTPVSSTIPRPAPPTLTASPDAKTSLPGDLSPGPSHPRKRVKPVLTLSPKDAPHSPPTSSRRRHLPMEAIQHAAFILSAQLPPMAFRQGPQTPQGPPETPSQPPLLPVTSEHPSRHEVVRPSAEVGIQVSPDNTHSLHQLSHTVDKMLQDHQQVLQEVIRGDLEGSSLEIHKTKAQGTSGESLSKGTLHGVIPTVEIDTKSEDEGESASLYNEMLAYADLHQRIESMESELERVEVSVLNDKQENGHHSRGLPIQTQDSKVLSKNSGLANSSFLPFSNAITIKGQNGVEATPGALSSFEFFPNHGESRVLKSKPQRGMMPDTVVRRLLAHQRTAHEYIAYNERQYNTSQSSQYVFAQRLTNALLEDCFTEVVEEVGHIMDDYVLGLVDHELQ